MLRLKLGVPYWPEHCEGHVLELIVSSELDWPADSSELGLAVSIFDRVTLFNQKMLFAEVVDEDQVSDLKHLILTILQVEMNRVFLGHELGD